MKYTLSTLMKVKVWMLAPALFLVFSGTASAEGSIWSYRDQLYAASGGDDDIASPTKTSGVVAPPQIQTRVRVAENSGTEGVTVKPLVQGAFEPITLSMNTNNLCTVTGVVEGSAGASGGGPTYHAEAGHNPILNERSITSPFVTTFIVYPEFDENGQPKVSTVYYLTDAMLHRAVLTSEKGKDNVFVQKEGGVLTKGTIDTASSTMQERLQKDSVPQKSLDSAVQTQLGVKSEPVEDIGKTLEASKAAEGHEYDSNKDEQGVNDGNEG